ncbi:hypothetical protein VPH35_002916 [Triticum aestivum]
MPIDRALGRTGEQDPRDGVAVSGIRGLLERHVSAPASFPSADSLRFSIPLRFLAGLLELAERRKEGNTPDFREREREGNTPWSPERRRREVLSFVRRRRRRRLEGKVGRSFSPDSWHHTLGVY